MIDINNIFISSEEITQSLADKVKKRRLEKGISRKKLQMMTGVPAPTIAYFENTSKISLESFVKLTMNLGYTDQLQTLMNEARYETMEEMETIKKNRNRKRGCKKC